MRRIIFRPLAIFSLIVLVGCSTIAGSVIGGGIGSAMGNATVGRDIGAAVGMIDDIWGY